MPSPITPRSLQTLLRSVSSSRAFASSFEVSPDPTHLNLDYAPPSYDAHSAAVYPNFITEEESKSIIKEVSKRMKRRRFEQGHWDSVIVGCREVELVIPNDLPSDSSTSNSDKDSPPLFVNAIRRTRKHLEAKHLTHSESIRWIPCHAIDLSADGRLDAHVDSIKFSGDIVAGISLLSDSIMRLKPCSEEWKSSDANHTASSSLQVEGHVDLYLPKLSLYVLAGMSRFTYTHELLPSGSMFEFTNAESKIEGVRVDRGRRLSVIFRDELRTEKK
ncbi:hypothetical protein ACHAXN_012437 [Cyclotella atomus]